MAITTDRRIAHPGDLSRHPRFLSGLKAEQKRLVLQSAEVWKLPRNSAIIHAGDLATKLFLLNTGRVKYYRITKKGDEVLLWWITPGEIFGIGSLLATPVRYIGTAESVEGCELFVWSHKKIRQLAAAYPRLAENALHIVLHYISEYSDRLIGLISETAEQRLARTIIRLGRRMGHVQSDGVELAITNESLGGLADVSPFTASRQLKQWEREGILQKDRGKILIVSPERLLVD